MYETDGVWVPASTSLTIYATSLGVASCANFGLGIPPISGSAALGSSSVAADGTISGSASIVGSGEGLTWQVFETWTGNINTGAYSYSESGTTSGTPFPCNIPSLHQYCGSTYNLSYSYVESGTLVFSYTRIN